MKDKFFSVTFVILFIFFSLFSILSSDQLISKSERRKLQQLPSFSISNVLNGSYMEDLDSYILDQFALRDRFRKIKANVSYNFLHKIDNNNIFIYNNHICKSEYTTNVKSIENFIDNLNGVGSYFTDMNNVFFAIIPDKNYYVDHKKYLNVDYKILYNKIKSINYKYIELRDILSLDDYYKTDTHWKQENLNMVVSRLGKHLGFENNSIYETIEYSDFYGVYYGQAGVNSKPDVIKYLVNKEILNSEVFYLENSNENKVYIEENLKDLDSYNIFLGGPSSYIEINNKLNNSGKELVIFRDSFASSLAPLLIDKYSKITLIDLRYIDSNNYLKHINFNNQDVLFLFSTLLVNNSFTLKN